MKGHSLNPIHKDTTIFCTGNGLMEKFLLAINELCLLQKIIYVTD